MSGESSQVVAAREAFERGEWSTARDRLRAADTDGALASEDLERRSLAAWLAGDVVESMADAETLFARLVTEERPIDAAQLALRLTLEWLLRGELQVATAWLGRAERLLADHPRVRRRPICSTYGRASSWTSKGTRPWHRPPPRGSEPSRASRAIRPWPASSAS